MRATIFLYSFCTSKKEINNIYRWFWLVTINKIFQLNEDFSASWPVDDIGAWSAVGYWRCRVQCTVQYHIPYRQATPITQGTVPYHNTDREKNTDYREQNNTTIQIDKTTYLLLFCLEISVLLTLISTSNMCSWT